jgi:hypothetical protein
MRSSWPPLCLAALALSSASGGPPPPVAPFLQTTWGLRDGARARDDLVNPSWYERFIAQRGHSMMGPIYSPVTLPREEFLAALRHMWAVDSHPGHPYLVKRFTRQGESSSDG